MHQKIPVANNFMFITSYSQEVSNIIKLQQECDLLININFLFIEGAQYDLYWIM